MSKGHTAWIIIQCDHIKFATWDNIFLNLTLPLSS